jgi:hypothetical protein
MNAIPLKTCVPNFKLKDPPSAKGVNSTWIRSIPNKQQFSAKARASSNVITIFPFQAEQK